MPERQDSLDSLLEMSPIEIASQPANSYLTLSTLPESNASVTTMDMVPLQIIYPDAEEQMQRRATLAFLDSLHPRAVTNETMPPPWTESEPPPEYSPRKSRGKCKPLQITLLFLAIDLALFLTLLFMTLLTAITVGHVDYRMVIITFSFVIANLLSNIAFLKQYKWGMWSTAIYYFARWSLDSTNIIMNFYNGSSVNISPFILVFTMPMMGIRIFVNLLFPCFDQTAFATLGHCPDRITIQGKPLDANYVYASMLLPHFIIIVVMFRAITKIMMK